MKPTIEQIRAHIAAHRAEETRRAEQQLDASDCALSSWASGSTIRVKEVEMELALHDWMAWFPTLLDAATGLRVTAKQINGKFGLCWMIKEPNGVATFVGTGERAMANKGFAGGWEQCEAHAKFKCNFVGDAGWVDIVRDSDDMGHGVLDKPEPNQTPKAKTKKRFTGPFNRDIPGLRCPACEAFFNRGFRCNAPLECDCPRCQGLCICPPARADKAPEPRVKRTRCADCGEVGERTGHQTCRFPQNH
jgi:hypothetical protein